MGTLASEAETGVWVQAPNALLRGGGCQPRKYYEIADKQIAAI